MPNGKGFQALQDKIDDIEFNPGADFKGSNCEASSSIASAFICGTLKVADADVNNKISNDRNRLQEATTPVMKAPRTLDKRP